MIVVAVSEGGLMGYYKTACICLNGHLVAGDSRSEDAAPKCPDCGATTISQCPDCSTDIRGTFDSDFGYYSPPPVKPYCRQCGAPYPWTKRSEEHTSELQSLMRISYAVFCLKKKKKKNTQKHTKYYVNMNINTISNTLNEKQEV